MWGKLMSPCSASVVPGRENTTLAPTCPITQIIPGGETERLSSRKNISNKKEKEASC